MNVPLPEQQPLFVGACLLRPLRVDLAACGTACRQWLIPGMVATLNARVQLTVLKFEVNTDHRP